MTCATAFSSSRHCRAKPTLRRPAAACRRQRGIGLVELMIGLTVGLLVVWAIGTLFSQLSRQDTANRELAMMAKTSRNTLYLLSHDLANAGSLLDCETLCDIESDPIYKHTFQYFDPGTSGVVYVAPAAGTLMSPGGGSLTFHYLPAAVGDAVTITYTLAANAGVPTLQRSVTSATANGISGVVTNTVASQVVALAVQFGTGLGNYSNTLAAGTMPVSVRIALLTRSATPDADYTLSAALQQAYPMLTKISNAAAINYVPGAQNQHYRYHLTQQEVFLRNAP